MGTRTPELLEEKLDAFVRALAIEAAREDHAKALKRVERRKGGRLRKSELRRRPIIASAVAAREKRD